MNTTIMRRRKKRKKETEGSKCMREMSQAAREKEDVRR